MYIEKVAASQASILTVGTVSPHRNNAGVKHAQFLFSLNSFRLNFKKSISSCPYLTAASPLP